MRWAPWPCGGAFGDSVASHQSLALLTALHNTAIYRYRGPADAMHEGHRLPANAAEQIAGVCAAVFDHDIAPKGFLRPDVAQAMDACGMGGDRIVTPNVSTAASLVASIAGAKMCKHGSPANADKGRCGSSDFVAQLGINTMAAAPDIAACLEQYGFAYTEALDPQFKSIHTQTHSSIRMPHMNDLIGPITNPLDPHLLTKRIMGINDLMEPALVAEAYRILNARGYTNMQRGLFIRGYVCEGREEGMDELSLCPGGTSVAELRDGHIIQHHLHAHDFGLHSVPVDAVSPPPGTSKGAFTVDILRGAERGPAAQMVAANAALLLCLHQNLDLSPVNLSACYKQADAILASGAAYALAQQVAAFVPLRAEPVHEPAHQTRVMGA